MMTDRDPFEDDSGIAETEALVQCPICWEESVVTLDPGSGTSQEYVEDCPVCCNPWRVSLRYDENGTAEVTLEPSDED